MIEIPKEKQELVRKMMKYNFRKKKIIETLRVEILDAMQVEKFNLREIASSLLDIFNFKVSTSLIKKTLFISKGKTDEIENTQNSQSTEVNQDSEKSDNDSDPFQIESMENQDSEDKLEEQLPFEEVQECKEDDKPDPTNSQVEKPEEQLPSSGQDSDDDDTRSVVDQSGFSPFLNDSEEFSNLKNSKRQDDSQKKPSDDEDDEIPF